MKWYKVRAKDMNINKPKGLVITFHIGGKSSADVRNILTKKGYLDIDIKENPNFEDSLK